jgi:hypothetical protein
MSRAPNTLNVTASTISTLDACWSSTLYAHTRCFKPTSNILRTPKNCAEPAPGASKQPPRPPQYPRALCINACIASRRAPALKNAKSLAVNPSIDSARRQDHLACQSLYAMADFKQDGPKADGSQMRERPSAKPLHLRNSEDAKQKVLKLNQEEGDNKDEEKRKTFGRTPDGTGGWAFNT